MGYHADERIPTIFASDGFIQCGLRVTACERPSFSAYADRTPAGVLLGFSPLTEIFSAGEKV